MGTCEMMHEWTYEDCSEIIDLNEVKKKLLVADAARKKGYLDVASQLKVALKLLSGFEACG
jgi:hypothetical protein